MLKTNICNLRTGFTLIMKDSITKLSPLHRHKKQYFQTPLSSMVSCITY